jgi:hypothetical protein
MILNVDISVDFVNTLLPEGTEFRPLQIAALTAF